MSLRVQDLTVEIDGHPILQNLSLEVPSGSTIAVVGPSGAGKSTLLRTIAGIIRPDSGSIIIDGIDVTRTPTHERNIGMVFQDDQLFPHLDVQDNIAFGLDMAIPVSRRVFQRRETRRSMRVRRARRVGDMLDLVGLPGYERRTIAGLSGGEAKRVALARALAPAPRILLLDEPLTALDQELHDRLMHDLAHILADTGTTTILVTHDLEEASRLAVRIVPLSIDQGNQPDGCNEG